MAVAIRRRSVDLPAPFGPRSRTTSPASMRRSTRTTAGAIPNTRVTPVRLTAGGTAAPGGERSSERRSRSPREATRVTGYRRAPSCMWPARWMGAAYSGRSMDVTHPLGRLLFEAAHDRFPPADGRVEVLPPPPGRSDAVVAFTAHSVVAAGVDPGEVVQRLPSDDLGAPTSAPFLAWLGERLGAEVGMIDLVMVAFGGEAERDHRLDLTPIADSTDHPRVARANRYRSDVVTYSDAERRGVVMIGRGLCERLEIAVEIYRGHRGHGLGREMARAAHALVPPDEPLFAQVTPGNTMSIRSFLAAGYRPICSEVLFLRAIGRVMPDPTLPPHGSRKA